MEGEQETSKVAKAKAVGSVFVPHPTLAIFRFWQGIVEIVLRAAVIVSLPRSVFMDVYTKSSFFGLVEHFPHR